MITEQELHAELLKVSDGADGFTVAEVQSSEGRVQMFEVRKRGSLGPQNHIGTIAVPDGSDASTIADMLKETPAPILAALRGAGNLQPGAE